MVAGSLSMESTEAGAANIVITVSEKDDVDTLTLSMMTFCEDVLYEPQDKNGVYESCLLCNEKLGIKFRTK